MIGSAVTTVATSTPYLAAATMAVLAGVVGASKYSEQNASTTVAATSVAAAALMAITYMAGGSMLIVGGISALAVAAVAGYEYKDSLQNLFAPATGSDAEGSKGLEQKGAAASVNPVPGAKAKEGADLDAADEKSPGPEA